MRHGDERQRRRREQDVADVEPRQKDVGSPGGVAADDERQQGQEHQGHPPMIADRIDNSPGYWPGRSDRARRRGAGLRPLVAVWRDRRKEETMDSSVMSAPFSSRITRPREKTSTRSQSPASSIASEELMTQATP